jgi:hypothetical protein
MSTHVRLALLTTPDGRATRRALAACALAVAIPTRARADAEPPPAEPPATEVQVGGYVEAYYQAHLQRPRNRVASQRAFDGRTDSFALANAVVDVQARRGRIAARIALQAGSTGAAYYQGEPTLPGAGGAPTNDGGVWRHLQLATMTIAAPRDVAVELGLFPSPIGLEVIPSKDDWNWSRSTLFFALPAYHAGVNVSRPLGGGVTARLHGWNGWNAALDGNATPTLGGSLALADERTSAQLLYVAGVERAPGAAEGTPVRHVLDAYVQRALSDRASVAVHVDAGLEPGDRGTSTWLAGAAYGKIALTRRLSAAVRLDAFRERPGTSDAGRASPIFFPSRWTGAGTVTLGYAPAEGCLLRLEVRHDQATGEVYFDGDVVGDAPTSTRQDTLTLGAVAWF